MTDQVDSKLGAFAADVWMSAIASPEERISGGNAFD
jgi:hypothetical protein